MRHASPVGRIGVFGIECFTFTVKTDHFFKNLSQYAHFLGNHAKAMLICGKLRRIIDPSTNLPTDSGDKEVVNTA
jgi:hypothetical protein